MHGFLEVILLSAGVDAVGRDFGCSFRVRTETDVMQMRTVCDTSPMQHLSEYLIISAAAQLYKFKGSNKSQERTTRTQPSP